MTTTTRRAAFGAIGSIAAAGFIAGQAARASSPSDKAIEAAFKRRQEAHAAYGALPLDNQPVVDGYGPGELELMEAIDAAEDEIRRAIAKTPRGAMLQLWCALYHTVSGVKHDEAILRGDFAELERADSGLDWSARLMLAGLRSLQAMEA